MAQTQGYPAVADILTYFGVQGTEEVTENNADFLTEYRQMMWRLMNRVEGAAALSVYADTTTTFRVQAGDYLWSGTRTTYAGSAQVNPTDDDITYVWMQGDNTIDSGIDGDGWPAEDHIRLAEVTVNASGTITDITDKRLVIEGNPNDATYADIVCVDNAVVCVDNEVVTI
ncbi:MAG: hypothetical protein GY841_04540 [FCB group bacterium]|nr:hypothetical protein [FCB group bacterium]